MLPIALIFTSGAVSGVNCYAAVLVLGLIGRFGHVAAIAPVLEKPSVLAAAAVLFLGQYIAGKIPVVDAQWDIAHTPLRPTAGGALGIVIAQHAGASPTATAAAAVIGAVTALACHIVKTGVRVGVNASPEPFSTITVSLLEDLGVASLTWWAVDHPRGAAAIAGVLLAAGLIVVMLLGTRIRRAWHHRCQAREWRHQPAGASPA